ncbi:winged helix-turn-helix domain-containing protein [Streptomyces sp. NBC_00568]|uniref:winged helix-turn-helix domain-containing protein n=1 Tax=Streptomyces sp. NBC_00568 TaxID=2975779 RepID=UPI0022553D42|nr:winged helix-turn-helix domain-containing protein [Streptomyces sp. NBC_00568]MCX4993551.1 winged helix-turn-helix domain-containing protein [Streptomyces sp. NBC_00568]
MRYPQGGGLTPQGQSGRERVRMLAAEGFARGEKNTVIAKDLRVSVRSVERWRRSWREGGFQALKASGPAKRPKVDDRDFALLEPLLLAGAVAQGWADERWTLSRVGVLIADRLGVSLSVRGVWELLRRHGWSCQRPVRRAAERDDAAVAAWVKETWPRAKPPRRRSGHGWSSRTKLPSR